MGFISILHILLLSIFTTRILCDVSVVKPNSGSTFDLSSGSQEITIEWVENNAAPLLSEMKYYSFLLCSGPNDKIQSIVYLNNKVLATEITDYTYTATIKNTVAKNGVFFVQVFASGDFGYTIHYSGRFTLTGMQGTVVPTSAAKTDNGAPNPQYYITGADGDGNDANTIATSINSASFSIPYPKQSGIVKYAPMQMQPKKKVTATTWTRQFPTSKVTFYGSFKKSLDCESTITPGWSYTITSDVNYATPASFPSDNGGWYDPKSKLSLTPRKMNLNNILNRDSSSTKSTASA
ncbi:Knh1p SCDLUD_004223 [Saccharomycodes ludwigii]|uniref:Knh1p n=1 Tax=Saccharomycodes ludwigii TaxID=36035 RepID=UPI001E87A27E|nr:hypothetical protein SCDLUD_004223 [Saccharomycodes ludwigii]KAH3899911.1 hypothetical protein SCDLUD_004223 [Saccharomycodes ludwigii]